MEYRSLKFEHSRPACTDFQGNAVVNYTEKHIPFTRIIEHKHFEFEPDLAQGKEHFDYKGFIPSDRLIREVQGDFGLVWDGNAVSACSGDWGYYLQYNNPHKTSLYIRCELPVIIWKKAALASFVKDNGIGICVDSLEELNDILNHLSPEDIINMKQNIKSVSQRLSVGYYTQSATRTAIEKLSS